MLKIVRTRLGTREPLSLQEDIKACFEGGNRGFLIVPEQDTVMREAAVAAMLPPAASLSFEVTNFTRFANTTFRFLGGVAGEYCSKSKRALIMWQALAELAPTLTMTGNRAEINAALVARATAAIGDLRAAGITPSDLSYVTGPSTPLADKRLRSKLADIELIYTLYKKLLSERYADSGDDYEAMLEKLKENGDFLSGTKIFIDSFNSFTTMQYRLIGVLSGRTDVSVYLPLPKGAEDAFEYTEVASAVAELKRVARLEGADVKISYDMSNTGVPEPIYDIASNLWRKTTDFDNYSLQNTDILRIFEADSPFEMCDFVASDIKRRVMAGASYSDFAVICGSASSYRGLIDTALADGDIPSFISYNRDASEFEAIKLIYTAYSAVRSGFAHEDVITYAKSGLCGISSDRCDELEMYVNTWRISGAAFLTEDPWNMSPRGYDIAGGDFSAKLISINETREAIISPLVKLKEAITLATTVRDHATALLEFLLSLNLEEQLERRAERLQALGESAQADDNTRLWGLICDTLDTLVEVSGNTAADVDSFLGRFKLLISGEAIGKIPAYSDRVIIGSASMLRLREKKHIYIIGLSAGELPATASDTAYFSERDKIQLAAAGLPLAPEAEKLNARELFAVSRAMCYAKESLTLLYSRTNSRFKSIEPSPVIEKIKLLTDGAVSPVQISSIPQINKIYSAEAALKSSPLDAPEDYPSIRAALERVGQGDRLSIGEGDITNGSIMLGDDICKELYSGQISLSQSKLDKFLSCPMSYFCRYTLGLRDETVAEFDASKIGSFIHSILENFFLEVEKHGLTPGTLTEKERRTLTELAAKNYIGSLGSDLGSAAVLTDIKLKRLCRAALPVVDGLCDEFAEGKFKPKLFELRISDTEKDTPAKVSFQTEEGHQVSIGGIVDRVDTYEHDGKVYVRVIDYKTGSKTFETTDMAEGKNLQMFLYLDSIISTDKPAFLRRLGAEGSEVEPAGVLYVKASVSDPKVDRPSDELAKEKIKASNSREGMILDDYEIISAMGLRYTPLYDPKKPGEINQKGKRFLFTKSGFEEIMKTVRSSVGKMADEIARGNCKATPKADGRTSSCDWCEFKPICRKLSK